MSFFQLFRGVTYIKLHNIYHSQLMIIIGRGNPDLLELHMTGDLFGRVLLVKDLYNFVINCVNLSIIDGNFELQPVHITLLERTVDAAVDLYWTKLSSDQSWPSVSQSECVSSWYPSEDFMLKRLVNVYHSNQMEISITEFLIREFK